MFSEELDELIRIAVKDGMLTGMEMDVLVAKADALGIDRNEFLMVLQDRLEARREVLDKEEEERWNHLAELLDKCFQKHLHAFSRCGFEMGITKLFALFHLAWINNELRNLMVSVIDESCSRIYFKRCANYHKNICHAHNIYCYIHAIYVFPEHDDIRTQL